VCENWFTGMSLFVLFFFVEEYKLKIKVTVPVYVAPTWRLERSWDPNQIWQGW